MKQVLLADDEEMTLDVTEQMLSKIKIGEEPLHVTLSDSVDKFFVKMETAQLPIDLIVIDDTLKGGRGGGALEVIQSLRGKNVQTPVIVIGGRDLAGMQERYEGIPDVHVAQKPVRLGDLMQMVQGLLGGARDIKRGFSPKGPAND